ncbi:hypothetical protein EDC94DRAFT_620445 [Helicostylum pulchrum]|nr:hypothetical protein EDC94DRAFT_620445 [Helicostylum pulchrum]
MEEVYDLHRHTDCVIFHFGKTTVHRGCFSTSTISIENKTFWVQSDSYIVYDKQKSNILSWGSENVANTEDSVHIDEFRDRLYQLFKKSREKWDGDDLFLLTAISDFIRLSVEKLMDENVKRMKDTDALHYVFVAPTEWEEEIRQLFIRPIFILANLISEDDHKDRLLFCSDVESVFYYFLTDYYYSAESKVSRNGIVGRIVSVKKNKVLVKLDLIFIGNPLFNFSNSLVFPKIVSFNSLSLTTSDIKSSIREFIKTRFLFDAQEETIVNIMEELDSNFYKNMAERDEASYLMIPFITDRNISEFDKHQKDLIRSIRPFDICAEISKRKTNNLKDLLQNNLLKNYSILKYTDKFSSKIELDKGLENWSRFLFEYNRISIGSSYIVTKSSQYRGLRYNYLLDGAALYLLNAVQNSDIYSKPRILVVSDNSVTSSSKFLQPDAIMSIGTSNYIWFKITVSIFFFTIRHFFRVDSIIAFTFKSKWFSKKNLERRRLCTRYSFTPAKIIL